MRGLESEMQQLKRREFLSIDWFSSIWIQELKVEVFEDAFVSLVLNVSSISSSCVFRPQTRLFGKRTNVPRICASASAKVPCSNMCKNPSWRNGLRLSQKEVAQAQASEAEKLKALEAMAWVGTYHQVLMPKYPKDGSHSLSPQWPWIPRNGMTRNDSYDHQVNHFHNSLPGISLHHELGLIVFVSVKHADASYGSVSFRDSSFRA